MATQKTRPPGRPTKAASGEAMKTQTFRRTEAQGAKYDALGGGTWLRATLDATPWPKGTKPK